MYRETGKRARKILSNGRHEIFVEIYKENVLVEIWFGRKVS
jgi:hypothetical protein